MAFLGLSAPEPARAASLQPEGEGAVGFLALESESGRKELREAIEGGLALLAGRQSDVGSVGRRYQVAVTSLAGLSFVGAGYGYDRGKHGRCVVKCVDYLLHTAQSGSVPGFLVKSGEDRDHPMHGHGYAILFLTQIYGELPSRRQDEVRVVIRRGIDVIASAMSFRGGWYYFADNEQHQDENSVTVCVLQALRAARNVGFAVREDVIEAAERYLKDCQKPDGSFCYSLSGAVDYSTFELTAGAVASLQALGHYGTDEVRKGVDYLQRCLNGFRTEPLDAAQKYRFYGNFYAAQAFHLAGEKAWRAWYPRALKQLVAEGRRADWCWASRFGDEYATAMAVLTLEVPLGYLPIFQK